MASNLMARLGPSSFEAQHLSENNAVKYRLTIRGSNNDSKVVNPTCSVNGTDYGPGAGRGLNAVVLDTNGAFVERRAFDIYGNVEHRSTIITYINSLPVNRIVCLFSFDAMHSSDDLDSFLHNIGSRCWPGKDFLNKSGWTLYRSSYSAVYNSSLRKICLENFVAGNSTQTEDTRSITEVTFDTHMDIGATGLPARIVDDPKEYTGNGTNYSYHEYIPSGKTRWSDYGLVTGDKLVILAELFVSTAAINAGAYAQMHLEWTKADGSYGGGTGSPQVKVKDTWTKIKHIVTVPDVVANPTFHLGTYHMPSSVKTGDVKTRNVILHQIARTETNKQAAFGVNGIRANNLIDNGNFSNPVMQLLNIPTQNNNITSNNFKETPI